MQTSTLQIAQKNSVFSKLVKLQKLMEAHLPLFRCTGQTADRNETRNLHWTFKQELERLWLRILGAA
ncbi:hypothetical protein Nepgr_030500 [Nepenthes gracilis]|uniref:Uncharacterized protein n=1 Tax=Nepenthes gracilis TaxID=150966 RepID=A0AAD3TFV8_NEPGR|nr:hypothetical protein Nepgr_030500 [Nepenthes gracilis]